MSERVAIRTFSCRHEADFWRSVLEAHGIAAAVSADDAGAIHPALALASGVHVLVAAGYAEQPGAVPVAVLSRCRRRSAAPGLCP